MGLKQESNTPSWTTTLKSSMKTPSKTFNCGSRRRKLK
nr:MAG TPA: hypothetical protein [Caudoviricetes sp.]